MTLHTFKYSGKLVLAIIALAFFGLGSFYVGRLSEKGLPKFNLRSAQQSTGPDSPVEKSIPASDVKSAHVIGASVKICSNTLYSYEVAYPKDWFTTYDKEEQKCTFFAPYSFVVPPDATITFVPINIEVLEPDKWQDATKFATNPNDFQNVISAENIEINGRPAVKVRAQTTGVGASAKNQVKLTYLIFDAKHPLALVYEQSDEKENVAAATNALEEMVSSLKFY